MEQNLINWARTYLASNFEMIDDQIVEVRVMPWSGVYRFLTADKCIYFKEIKASSLVIEPIITKFIYNNISRNVPKIIAANNQLKCFLMEDAGKCLRDKNHFDFELLSKALRIYAQIQQDSIAHIDTLLSSNILDWRLDKLPALYLNLINEEGFLVDDGLSKSEIEILHKLYPNFCNLCLQLSQYDIPPSTIEHCDFHDNNILVKDNDEITISDWGDAVISHPFLSLASCLDSAARHHALQETDINYINLQQAYLENWLEYESYENLISAFQLAQKIRPIEFALSFKRVQDCVSKDEFQQFNGSITEIIRNFIKSLSN